MRPRARRGPTRGRVSAFAGAFYDLPASRQYPKPVQQPHPPIYFGGESDAALRRVADQGQGWYPFSLEPEALADRLVVLDRMLARRGRSRREVQLVVCPIFDLPASRQYPKPVQQPHPPIYFGGESDAAMRRVADQGQGWYPFSLEPEALADRLVVLDRMLARRGRSRREVQLAVCPYLRPADLELVKRYRDVGADQVVLFAFAATPDELRGVLDHLAESIVEPARSL